MRTVSEKRKSNAHFAFRNFSPENRATYETMWENTVQPDKSEVAIQDGL